MILKNKMMMILRTMNKMEIMKMMINLIIKNQAVDSVVALSRAVVVKMKKV